LKISNWKITSATSEELHSLPMKAIAMKSKVSTSRIKAKKPVWFITGCSTGFGRDLATEVLERGYQYR
jgi:hypothetical protein